MVIAFDRDSICMGDDCMSHNKNHEFPDFTMASALLSELAYYVPAMHNVVWAVISLNSVTRVIGFILTDNQGSAKIELNTDDMVISELFDKNLDNISVFCKHYYQGSFSWYDKSGKNIEKYSEYKNLIDKVKLDCGV